MHSTPGYYCFVFKLLFLPLLPSPGNKEALIVSCVVPPDTVKTSVIFMQTNVPIINAT